MCCGSVAVRVDAQDKYCGIYSLYAAAASLGVDVDFDILATPSYVSSMAGSSADDLVRAAKRIGLNGYPLAGLSIGNLEAFTQPVLLNVYTDGQLDYPSHWIVFLGIEDGRVKIGDGADGIVYWSKAELLIVWRGAGIVITKSEEQVIFSIIFSQYCTAALVVLSAVIGIFFFALVSKSNMYAGLIGLTVGTACMGFTASCLSSDGIGHIKNRASLIYVEELTKNASIPEIRWFSLVRDFAATEYLLIDSRLASDYQKGTISGSINVPVNCTRVVLQEALNGIDRNITLVVFCQSRECHFSRAVAKRLIQHGFKVVYVLDVGYNEVRAQAHVLEQI
jgi:rhodanese-related sulfurtransferase